MSRWKENEEETDVCENFWALYVNRYKFWHYEKNEGDVYGNFTGEYINKYKFWHSEIVDRYYFIIKENKGRSWKETEVYRNFDSINMWTYIKYNHLKYHYSLLDHYI